MTARIRIIPSGHEFISEGRATLLEAGLSAGLALAYGCSNGNCGERLSTSTVTMGILIGEVCLPACQPVKSRCLTVIHHT